MRSPDWLTDGIFIKLMALLLSLLIWGGVMVARSGTAAVKVPVRIVNLAPGLTVKGELPREVELRVAGPRLLIYRMRRDPPQLPLDFSGVVAGGTVTFDQPGLGLTVAPGLQVIRTVPGRFHLAVEPIPTHMPR